MRIIKRLIKNEQELENLIEECRVNFELRGIHLNMAIKDEYPCVVAGFLTDKKILPIMKLIAVYKHDFIAEISAMDFDAPDENM
jgi:hypothetical protein